jgi:hypothetical protein
MQKNGEIATHRFEPKFGHLRGARTHHYPVTVTRRGIE